MKKDSFYKQNNKPTIGIYVSQHGLGHQLRAMAIAKQAPEHFTLLGSHLTSNDANISIIELPQPEYNNHFSEKSHFKAQKNIDSYQKAHLQALESWMNQAKPALMLIDSSVQVAELAKNKQIPYVFMRLSGQQNDPSYLEAFRNAKAVLCPYHKLLESETTPKWLRARSKYYPGLTQHISLISANDNQHENNHLNSTFGKTLLIIAGHSSADKRHLKAKSNAILRAAQSLTDWKIQVIGQGCPKKLKPNLPSNLQFTGWVEHPDDYIKQATLVMGAASDCLLSTVAAAGKSFICMPQKRAFNEQYEKAIRLEKLNAATISHVWPHDWPKLVDKAQKKGSVLSILSNSNAAALTAKSLLNLACEAQNHNQISLKTQSRINNFAYSIGNHKIGDFRKRLIKHTSNQRQRYIEQLTGAA